MANRFKQCPCCAGKQFTVFFDNPVPKKLGKWQEFFYGGAQYLSTIDACANCGFQWQRDLPENYQKFYETHETSGYGDLSDSRDRYFAEVKGIVLSAGKVPLSDGILDIACGDGAWLKQWKNDTATFGSELNPEHRKKLHANGITVVDDREIARKRFSIISFFDFLEHVEQPGNFLTSIKPALADDSLVVIGVPDMGKLAAQVLKERYYLYCPMHFSYFTRKSLSLLLQKYLPGFDITVHASPPMRFNVEGVLKWIGLPDLRLGRLNFWFPFGYSASLIALARKKARDNV